MTQTSDPFSLSSSNSSCKHRNNPCSTCAFRPRRRMRSLWRWALEGKNRSHSKMLHARVFLCNCCISGSSFVKEEGRSVFPTCGAISIEYDEKTRHVSYKNKPRSLTVPVVTHSYLMKPRLILRDTFTQQCHARLKTSWHNRLEFSLLFFFSSSSDGNEEKIARKQPRGRCW